MADAVRRNVEQNVTLGLLALPEFCVLVLEDFVTPRASCVDGSMHNVQLCRVKLAKHAAKFSS